MCVCDHIHNLKQQLQAYSQFPGTVDRRSVYCYLYTGMHATALMKWSCSLKLQMDMFASSWHTSVVCDFVCSSVVSAVIERMMLPKLCANKRSHC